MLLLTYACHPCVQSLSGNRLSLRTENGVVRGTYKAMSLLEFQTSNAPISVYATLVSGVDRPTNLMLKTTNGYVPLTTPM